MFTPTMVIAGLGFLRNTGIRPSRTLEDLVVEFSTRNISGAVQSRLNQYSQNQDNQLFATLQQAPSFMTGIEPPGVDIGTGDIANIPAEILSQGRSFFQHPQNPGVWQVPSYFSSFSSASGYAYQTYGFYNVVERLRGQPYDSLGFQYKNFQDIYTCGVSNQFNIERLPDLAKELPNAGNMYSTEDLTRINDTASISKNLIGLGLGKTGDLEDKIAAAGIDLDNPTDADRVKLNEIFRSIRGNDLREIVEVTGFKPNKPENINSLADVLESRNVFSDQALGALGSQTSFSELARKLSNIGGKFADMTGISQLYGGIKSLTLPLLRSINGILPDSYTEGLDGIFGRGTGRFRNPTMNDLVGTSSGVGYTRDLEIMISAQKRALVSSNRVVNFVNYLNSGYLDLGTLSNLIHQVNTDPGLQDLYLEGSIAMLSCTERLYAERLNLQLAGITPGTIKVPNIQLVNASSQLHVYGQDSFDLGLGNQFINMATDNVYGEAVKACVIEGKNIAKMTRFGINPGIKVDPADGFTFPTSSSD